MKFLPVNTALYNPPKQIGNKLANPNEPVSEEENSGEDTEVCGHFVNIAMMPSLKFRF